MASFRWLCLVSLLIVGLSGYQAKAEGDAPTFSQCKVHIEAAIKEKTIEPPLGNDNDEVAADHSNEGLSDGENAEVSEEPLPEQVEELAPEEVEEEETQAEAVAEAEPEIEEHETEDEEKDAEQPSEEGEESAEQHVETEAIPDEVDKEQSESGTSAEEEQADEPASDEVPGDAEQDDQTSVEEKDLVDSQEEEAQEADKNDEESEEQEGEAASAEGENASEEEEEEAGIEAAEVQQDPAADVNESEPEPADSTEGEDAAEPGADSEPEVDNVSTDDAGESEAEPEHDQAGTTDTADSVVAEAEVAEGTLAEEVVVEAAAQPEEAVEAPAEAAALQAEATAVEEAPQSVEEAPQVVEEAPVEEAPFEGVIEEEPPVKRSRDHIAEILRLEEELENVQLKKNAVQITLREVKKVVETAVRPLEEIYKYKDVSNRHFGDNEIFSKPLVLFLGPWSGGKSSIINYLLGNEFTKNALKSGAEPSATYFQIMMHGDEEEHLDGTQLAADWTFSGLQKFGQAFIDRLRGKKLPNKILQKANIVEIPGILEMRREVDRPYPFNDVVQWFVDRADLIFVVYDPTKLDMGLEHEAVFDQLKGRQNQVRVLLNKADTVSQEELLLIQNNLMWQLSPLLASALPPVVYAGSFWSKPYSPESPARLLKAHEENMLNDIREALDNVVENTIAEARRHAVRVRNHAKMVDCYLTTFFNHKSYFGNKKTVMEDIIENPHQYHIFEGLSTLTNISRYDLPDADVYRDFFKVHKLYEFQNLASTCSFFRGCPIDKLDVAISYELPELIGKYKKRVQQVSGKKVSKKQS